MHSSHNHKAITQLSECEITAWQGHFLDKNNVCQGIFTFVQIKCTQRTKTKATGELCIGLTHNFNKF